MKYTVSHTTTYRYAKAVSLGSHVIRLQPRANGDLLLQALRCEIEPKPCADCRITLASRCGTWHLLRAVITVKPWNTT